MKKALHFAALLAIVLFGFSCTKNNGDRTDTNPQNQNENQNGNENQGQNGNENQGQNEPPTHWLAKTGADNLVLWLTFDEDKIIEVGEGVTLDGNKGKAALGKGFIGKAWNNGGGVNTEEAYTKLNLAAGNALTQLESFTFSAWAKLPKDKEAKCGIISFNGTGAEAIWPSFIFIFDNISDVEMEDGTKFQALQFNGRIDFLTLENKPILWPNCAAQEYMVKDEWFQLARTYDAATGHWANYANGQIVNEGDFLVNDKPGGPVNSAFAADCNALYVGGWASRIEGKASDTWQSYCPGSLDELRFYNKALSPEEIAALYKEELAINVAQED